MHRLLALGLMALTVAASAQPPQGGPPPEAFSACRGQSEGAACRFTNPHGQISGSCRTMREGRICVPEWGAEPAAQGGRPPVRVAIADHDASAQQVSSHIPDTHQGSCFNNSTRIDCPRPGQPFYGQDAQYEGAAPSYRDNGNGTVTDLVTGLVWQQRHNARRLGYADATRSCAALDLGGRDDWRLPSIKELYSLADYRGAAGARPYLNEIFEIHEPDADILKNDRFASTHRTDMMGQTWSSTLYAGDHWDRPGIQAAFFFNFLDGRIKQAPTNGPNSLFYRCVSGPQWGANDFADNHDGTITDRASGLTWQQADDGKARNWQESLAYCEDLNLAGHDDWRLPNVKELESIVDYSRPEPAIDTGLFSIRDPKGWFWSSTTLGENTRQATYVCFGKCVSVEGIDVHGAGAQRSDPKTGNPANDTAQGGQHDAIRIHNYARCVRSTR